MGNQVKEDHEYDAMDNEDFPDDFQCCVCLDLLYKPVVLACGHMACFWCIYKAMDYQKESHCPLCRHPYNNFPRVCRLLHFLLLKLYPLAHERREKQVSEKENKSGYVSQQFNCYMSDSQPHEVFSASIAPKSDASKGEPSSDSSQTIIPEDCKTTVTASSSYEDTNVSTQKNGLIDDESLNGTPKKVVMSDLTCAICKQLLCRPVVLNCGDVYCEACIINSSDKECKCPACQSSLPNGFSNVCLVLEHFLEEQFPLEYAAREESLRKQSDGHMRMSIGSIQDQEEAAQGAIPTNGYASWCLGQGAKVHYAAGCDYCGMYPIIGECYRCKDCKEKIGFDLCEGCYNSSCKLPGRFNQQHKEDHQFEIVEPRCIDHITRRIGAEQEDVSPTSNSTYDGSEDVEDSAEEDDTSEDDDANSRASFLQAAQHTALGQPAPTPHPEAEPSSPSVSPSLITDASLQQLFTTYFDKLDAHLCRMDDNLDNMVEDLRYMCSEAAFMHTTLATVHGLPIPVTRNEPELALEARPSAQLGAPVPTIDASLQQFVTARCDDILAQLRRQDVHRKAVTQLMDRLEEELSYIISGDWFMQATEEATPLGQPTLAPHHQHEPTLEAGLSTPPVAPAPTTPSSLLQSITGYLHRWDAQLAASADDLAALSARIHSTKDRFHYICTSLDRALPSSRP